MFLPNEIELVPNAKWDPDAMAILAARAATNIRQNASVLIPIVFQARANLANPGARTDLAAKLNKEVPTFDGWIKQAELKVSTVYDWLERYDDSGHLLEQQTTGDDPTAPRTRAQITVRYPKHVEALDRALLKFYNGTLENFAGGARMPERTAAFLEHCEEAWPAIYRSVMGSDATPGFLEGFRARARSNGTGSDGARQGKAAEAVPAS